MVEKILLAVIGIHLGCYAVALLWFKRTYGAITHFERELNADGDVSRGIIEFKDEEGVIRELPRWIAMGEPLGGGLRVTVLYWPKYPKIALEWSAGAFLGIPTILGLVILAGRLFAPYFQ
jgi:hypothetical protein